MKIAKFMILAALLGVMPAMAQYPVRVRPDIVKVEFENEQIRVLRVHYGPHEKLPMHSHPGRVVIALTAKRRMPDGTMKVMESGGMPAYWSDKVTHEEENTWDDAREDIEIEVKKATVPAVEVRPVLENAGTVELKEPVPVEKEPHHNVMFQNQFVRVLCVWFSPREPSLFQTHSNDNVSVALSGDLTKSQPMGGEWNEPVKVVHGQVAFHKAKGQPYTHRVGSAGEKPYHVIDVEIFP